MGERAPTVWQERAMGRRPPSSSSSSSSSGSLRFGVRPRLRGVVNSWNVEKQFGFISCEGDRPDVFFHAEGIRDLDVRDVVKTKGLKRGDRVDFITKEPEGNRRKCEAQDVELIDDV